ncbi:MAG TPA: hypothetical protein VFW66_06275 [Gemmatimonadales bacterium]|nr:hypothetical protein [Gemmatimonadales bacterium]
MAMLPSLMLGVALGPTPLAAQSESLRAAAKLSGLTTGMAQACLLDPTPVLHAFRDLMDRKQMQGAQRSRLVKLVTEASDQGAATQQQPGAMSCAEVRGQIRRTTRRLRRAK